MFGAFKAEPPVSTHRRAYYGAAAGAAAVGALAAGAASAHGYGYGYDNGYADNAYVDNGYVDNGYVDNGYAAPVADLAAPGYGYGYAAPAYAAPAQAGTTIIIVTPGSAPAYGSAAGGIRLLRGRCGFAADLQLRTRLLGRPRVLAPMVVVDRRTR